MTSLLNAIEHTFHIQDLVTESLQQAKDVEQQVVLQIRNVRHKCRQFSDKTLAPYNVSGREQ